jgi:ferric-dicitrate binding protein FerR (iron transport regulator)
MQGFLRRLEMTREHDQLVAAYLAGENVAAELLPACQERPELLTTLAEHRALGRLLAAEHSDADVFAAELRARLEAVPDPDFGAAVRQRLAPRKRRGAIMVLAAAICLLAGALLWLWQPVPCGSMQQVSGEIYLESESGSEQAVPGAPIHSGAVVHCAAGANDAVVVLRDGSRITLTAGTRILFAQVEGQFRLDLREGLLTADVQKQPEGRPMVITTSDATVTVLGTRLKLSAAPRSQGEALAELASATTLVVDEGSVAIEETHSGERVVVHSQEIAIASTESTLEAEGISDLAVDSLEIIHASYGARSSWIDVTETLRARANDSRLLSTGMFNNLLSDPLHKVVKTLKIHYRIDGQAGRAEFSELEASRFRSALILPQPGAAEFATVTQETSSSRRELAFAGTVSDRDLLHGLQPETQRWQSANSATPFALNDGIHGDTYAVDGSSSAAETSERASVTFDLGLGAGQGWDLTRIQSVAAWVNAGFGNQAYIVEVKQVGARDFRVLDTVDFQPLPNDMTGAAIDPGATRVTLRAPSGVLASGVEAIRFTANRVNCGKYGGAFAFREIDVFGVETKNNPDIHP